MDMNFSDITTSESFFYELLLSLLLSIYDFTESLAINKIK